MSYLATVAICTYKRPDCLGSAIQSVLAQTTSFAFDLLVIDNDLAGSSREITEYHMSSDINVIYIIESRKGLSYARNRALSESESKIIVFIDDDAIAKPGWLENVVNILANDDAVISGGKISLIYTDKRPDWITDKMESYLSRFDEGEIIHDTKYVYGCNFAVNRQIAIDLGGFDPCFGYSGSMLLPGEETDLCIRATNAGYRIVYVPDAEVDHIVDPSRLTVEWFRKRIYGSGYATVKLKLIDDGFIDFISGKIWSSLNSAARMTRGEYDQALHWKLEHAFLSGCVDARKTELTIMNKIILFVHSIPVILKSTIVLIRDIIFGRKLAIPPLEQQ